MGSNASDSSKHHHHHISIPQKDAIAIVPPKKVIKALYSYAPDPPNGMYLKFSEGDFLHVVGREEDPDWYEACNPILNTRGLVPVNYFELVSRQVRNSDAQEVGPLSGNSMQLVDRSVAASRIGSMSQQRGHDSGYGSPSQMNGTGSLNGAVNGGPSSASDQNGGLRASAMARTSGAMVYGMVLYDFKAERPDELQASAGEAIIVIAQSNPEWFVAKPITRLGGPGLIPVSFIEIRDTSTGAAVTDPHEAVRRAGVPRVEEWKRMAANYKNSSIPLGRLGSVGGAAGQEDANQGQQYQQQPTTPQQQIFQTPLRYSQMSTPLKAQVPRYAHHEAKFWFVVEAYMDDGKFWELSREYTDFYALQTTLMEQFPDASGKTGQKRLLPFMPGPLPWVTERLTADRREHMDKYLVQLIQLGSQSELGHRIINSQTVREFFVPRGEDREAEGFTLSESEAEWVRLSQSSSQHSFQPQDSRQSSSGNLSANNNAGQGYMSPPRNQQQGAGYGAQSPNHYRSPSDMRAPSGGGNGYGQAQQQSSGRPVKVKAYLDNDNTVMLRLTEGFSYQTLVDKVQERWQLEHPGRPGVEHLVIDFKDESNGAFYQLSNDSDLHHALGAGEKLTIKVSVEGAY